MLQRQRYSPRNGFQPVLGIPYRAQFQPGVVQDPVSRERVLERVADRLVQVSHIDASNCYRNAKLIVSGQHSNRSLRPTTFIPDLASFRPEQIMPIGQLSVQCMRERLAG